MVTLACLGALRSRHQCSVCTFHSADKGLAFSLCHGAVVFHMVHSEWLTSCLCLCGGNGMGGRNEKTSVIRKSVEIWHIRQEMNPYMCVPGGVCRWNCPGQL